MINGLINRSISGVYLAIIIVGAATISGFATGSVTLSWNPSPSYDVNGYYVYYGLTSGIYDHEISVGMNTTVVISNLVEGATYYFAATSHDGGESPFSNEASCTVPLNATNPPAALTLPASANGQFSFGVSGLNASQYVVEASPDLIHWTPVATNVAPFTFTPTNVSVASQQFFRAILLDIAINSTDLTALPAAKINTPISPQGIFSLAVQGVSGQTYVVESSSDLKNWAPMLTNTAPFTFTTANTSSANQKFYRAILMN